MGYMDGCYAVVWVSVECQSVLQKVLNYSQYSHCC